MDARERNFLLVGALLAGGAASLAYLYNKAKDDQLAKFRPRTVSRKLIIRILKEIQREMFGVLTSVAMITTQIKDQSKARVTPEEIKDFLLEHNTQTKEKMKKISDTICGKYGVHEYELKYACENTYTDDKEIQTLLEEARVAFEKAFTGVAPELRTELPDFLTPEVTLNILKKIMKESVFKIQEFMQDLKEKGVSLSFNNSQVLLGIQNLRLDDLRKEILVKEGLDKFKAHPLKIFQYAIQKYSTEDIDSFNQKVIKLEMQNQRAMDALMKDELNAPIMIEAIGAHLINESEEIVASQRLQKNKAYQASVAAKRAEAADFGIEEDEAKAFNNNIRTLQHDVSYQLRNALDDSAFPEEIFKSAVNSVFPVFNSLNKENTNEVSMMSHDQTFVTARTEEVVLNKNVIAAIPNKSDELKETVIIERSEVEAQDPEVPTVDDAEAQKAKEAKEESGFVTVEDSEKEN